MSHFLKRVLWFLLLGLVFCSIADLFISNRLKKTNLAEGEYSVWNDIYSGNMNYDLVILGSSRAWVHINPEIFKENQNINSYNLGVDGHNFIIQFFRFREFISKNNLPEYVILSLDVFTLGEKRELYNYQQFFPYMLWNIGIYEATKSYVGFSKYDFIFPLLRYFGSFSLIKDAFQKKNMSPIRKNGYQGQNRAWNSDFENAKKEKGQIKIEFDSAAIDSFDQFLEYCLQSDIKLAFVYSPEYFEGHYFVRNRTEIFEVFQDYSDELNIPFLDYSHDEMSYQRDYFYNATHLNKEGSNLFSKKLVEDLDKIGFFSR